MAHVVSAIMEEMLIDVSNFIHDGKDYLRILLVIVAVMAL